MKLTPSMIGQRARVDDPGAQDSGREVVIVAVSADQRIAFIDDSENVPAGRRDKDRYRDVAAERLSPLPEKKRRVQA